MATTNNNYNYHFDEETNCEIFKRILDYPNYCVSTHGNVFSKKTGRILKPGDSGEGYPHVVLCEDRKTKNKYISKLVATTFLPNPNEFKEVDHIDGNPLNNHVSNLRWCNCSQNKLNTKIRKDNTSGYKGISYHKQNNGWQAFIYINGKLKRKYFKNKEDAIAWRAEMVKIHYDKIFYKDH